MPELILIGSDEQITTLEEDDNPADNFPFMLSEGVHSELRTQLYALLLGVFFDEAAGLEVLTVEYSPYGPFLFRLDDTINDRLADIEEDDVEALATLWSEATEGIDIGVFDKDLIDLFSRFLFNLIHFCQMARQEPDLAVFIFADG